MIRPDLKQVAGFWLPVEERDLVPFLKASPRFFKGPTYQADKLLACLPWIRRFGRAVDVGAHCGLWSRVLVKMFAAVEAFEPIVRHRECFIRNVEGAMLHPYALGAQDGVVSLETGSPATGGTHVAAVGGDACAPLRRLDGLGLGPVDFLKIDCEGYEAFVLEGAEQLVRRDRPCVIVEQKAGMAQRYGRAETGAVSLLEAWGATLRGVYAGDYILSWDRPC